MKKSTGLGALFLMAACAPLMHATIQLSYQETSPLGPATVCGSNPISAGPVTCNFTVTGATIDVLSATSNSPGTPGIEDQFGSDVHISTTQAVTLDIFIAAQGFTGEKTPPPIFYSSELSITSTEGSGTVGLISCVDGSNGLTPPTTPFCSVPDAKLTNGTENYSGSSSNQNTVTTAIGGGVSTPYSLGQEIILNLGANSELNFTTSQVLSPVPEPATFTLLGGGLVVAGLLFRRKLNSKRS